MVAIINTLLFAAGASALVFERAVCNADNCARAVTGSNVNSASRVGTDCARFQTTTVCPTPTTTIKTSGLVATTMSGPACAAITAKPTLPAYAAAACSSGNNPSSRFSSACSCAGSTVKTVTAPQQTVTVITPNFVSGMCDTNPDQTLCQSEALVPHQFKIYRGAYFGGNGFIGESNVIVKDQQECVNLCASTPTCVAAVVFVSLIASSQTAYCGRYAVDPAENYVLGPFADNEYDSFLIPGTPTFVPGG